MSTGEKMETDAELIARVQSHIAHAAYHESAIVAFSHEDANELCNRLRSLASALETSEKHANEQAQYAEALGKEAADACEELEQEVVGHIHTQAALAAAEALAREAYQVCSPFTDVSVSSSAWQAVRVFVAKLAEKGLA